MLKVLGILFVLAGCIYSGVISVVQLNQRAASLQSLAEGLELIGYELEFRMESLGEILSVTANKIHGSVKRVFQYSAEQLATKHDGLFCDIWKQAVLEFMPELKQRDVECVQTVGAVLGRYDVESQLSVIRTTTEQLKHYAQEALAEKKEKGKLYGAISTAAGLFIIIFLI